MKHALATLAALCLPACSMVGKAGIAGSFEAPAEAPNEVRYLLHPDYGQSSMDRAFGTRHADGRDYQSLFPDATGAFASPMEGIYYHSPPMKAPPPTFWLSFSNEKSVVYAVGWGGGGFDYRTLDSQSYALLDRAETCWVVKSGEFTYPPEGEDREVQLKVLLARNAAVTPCAEAG